MPETKNGRNDFPAVFLPAVSAKRHFGLPGADDAHRLK